MKNHVRVDGKLLQTNKKFSDLKMSQKEFIANTFRVKYHQKMEERGTTQPLPKKVRDEVIDEVYEAIQERDIWIPFYEVEKFCFGKIRRTVNKYAKKMDSE